MGERPLHIGVDARELMGQPTGVGRYLANVLREWRQPTFGHRVTLFVTSRPGAELERDHAGMEWVVEPGAGTRWEQTRLPRLLSAAGVDVFFAAAYTAPFRVACPFVVAVYDVSFFAHPEWFGWREGTRRRWLTGRAAQRAATVVTISEFSAQEIVRWLGVERERVVLAPPGAPALKPGPAAADRAPLILFVGSLFTRRHIPELLQAFVKVQRHVPGARLMLVGDNRTKPRIDPLAMASRLGIRDHMEWRHYAGDVELNELYASARVFAFLSAYEGFAMTPMEALAAGVPPVLLDTPVAREVYGDAAVFTSASPDHVSDALLSLLTDSSAHEAVMARGRQRLEQFSWSRTAATVLHALEQAARQ